MSVILDALKKAQDERRRTDSRPADGDGFPPRKRIGHLYYLFGFALLLLAITFSLPHLRQSLRLSLKTGETPAVMYKSPPLGNPVTQGTAKPGEQKTAETGKQEILREKRLASKGVPESKAPQVISWNTNVPVAAAGRQGPLSAVLVSPQESKPSSPFGADQSIIVKKSDVKDSTTEFYNKALKEMELGRAEDARRSYLAVLADKPDDAETLNNLGVLIMNGGNTRDAFSYFKMALDCRADYPKAHNNLGMLYMKEGQNRPAEEHLRRALKLDPHGVEPYLNLSALLRSEGRFEEGSQLLSGLLQKGCKQPVVHLSYAIINDEMGNYREAVTHYREYLSQASQGAERSRVAERLKVLESHPPSGIR